MDIERLIKAPFTTKHESVLEAILADLADVVPIIGEIAGIVRIMEGMKEKDDVRVAMELGDLIAGFPPLVGDVLDILTPTNLLLYLMKRERVKV